MIKSQLNAFVLWNLDIVILFDIWILKFGIYYYQICKMIL